MTYGTIKVDTVTFTDAGIDKSVTLSGLVQNPTFSGNVTVTGTLSGVTVTGTTANFTSGNFTNISGGTHTITSGVFAAGSAASPSITFTGDLNTGIYSPGADQVAISTGGSGRLFVDASGNIKVLTGEISQASASSFIRLDGGTGTGTGGNVIVFGESHGSAPGRVALTAVGTGAIIGSTGGFERLRITSAGLVGVGTSTPNAALEVSGPNSDSFGQLNLRATGTGADAQITFSTPVNGRGIYVDDSDSNKLKIYGGAGKGVAGHEVTITNTGSLGVGTTSPQLSCVISNGGAQGIELTGFNAALGTPLVQYYDRNASAWLDVTHRANSHRFNGPSSEWVRIDSSGRVGIGTSVPQGLVSLSKGTGNTAPTTVTAANSFINIGISEYGAASNGKYMVSYGYSSGATNAPAYIGLEQTSTGSYTCGDLTFYTRSVTTDTAPTERLRITNAGLVGIGTTSVNTTLEVLNSSTPIIRVGDGIRHMELRGGSTGQNAAVGTNYGGGFDIIQNGSAAVTIDTSKRVLVGTSSAPSALSPSIQSARPGGAYFVAANTFSVSSSGDILGEVHFLGNQSGGYVHGATISATADATWSSSSDGPTRLVFSVTRDGQASPTERLRIRNDGVLASFSAGDNGIFQTAAAAGTTVAVLNGYYGATANYTGAGTRSFLVWSNGNVQNTNNSYTAISDIKLKENIVDASSQWADLKALRVRNYNLKEGQTHRQIGLIAQEVEPISPGLVYESPDRDADGNDLGTVTKSVNYSVLYMKAVKALQEAMERIETLEAKVAALESA